MKENKMDDQKIADFVVDYFKAKKSVTELLPLINKNPMIFKYIKDTFTRRIIYEKFLGSEYFKPSIFKKISSILTLSLLKNTVKKYPCCVQYISTDNKYYSKFVHNN